MAAKCIAYGTLKGDKIGFELGLFWLCFFVKSSFSVEKRIKLGLFCIKRADL